MTHSEQYSNRLSLDGKPCDEMLLGDLRLPNRPESAAAARRFAASIAVGWNLGHVIDTLELLLSELVGNAHRHAAEPADPAESMLRVVLFRHGERLRAEVHDPSRSLPRLKQAGEQDESGRGYFLVVMLADEVGSYPTPDGKAVWFSLSAWTDALAA